MQSGDYEVVGFKNSLVIRYSIRQTRGVMNQMRLKRERNENLRKMLLAHMPYVYNCYKLEEVETVGNGVSSL